MQHNAHILDYLYHVWRIEVHFAVLRGMISDHITANRAGDKYAAEAFANY